MADVPGSGLRKDEALGLTWPDIDLDAGLVGTPLEPRNINHEWAKVCTAAGIAPIRPHDLRHSTATFALRQGWI